MNKKIKLSILLVIIIIINYILTRFVFFNLHNMKDWTDFMTLLSACLTCILLLSNNIVGSIFSSIGNIISFFIGLNFYTEKIDYITGNTNNMWLIWTVSYIIIVIIGIVINKLFHVKHK